MNIKEEMDSIDNLKDIEVAQVYCRKYIVALQLATNEIKRLEEYSQQLEAQIIKENET